MGIEAGACAPSDPVLGLGTRHFTVAHQDEHSHQRSQQCQRHHVDKVAHTQTASMPLIGRGPDLDRGRLCRALGASALECRMHNPRHIPGPLILQRSESLFTCRHRTRVQTVHTRWEPRNQNKARKAVGETRYVFRSVDRDGNVQPWVWRDTVLTLCPHLLPMAELR